MVWLSRKLADTVGNKLVEETYDATEEQYKASPQGQPHRVGIRGAHCLFANPLNAIEWFRLTHVIRRAEAFLRLHPEVWEIEVPYETAVQRSL